MSDRPNILLIHSDQHRYDCIHAHGLREGLHTPHLDSLAAAGTHFTRAYSTIPICTPARASLLTGAWPTTHGSYCIPTSELDRAARPQLPLLTELLTGVGYRHAWTGKYHGELETYPTGRPEIEEYVAVWDYRKYRAEADLPPLEKPHGLFGDVDASCPPEQSALAWQADHVIRQIEERRDGPFFVRWDPPEPHLPCNPSEPFANSFANVNLAPWQSFPDDLSGKPAAQRRQMKIWGVEGWTWEDWLPVVRLYHGIIAEMDHHIGRVLGKLDELGLADNTLVIYSTDHGDFCGGHGQMDKHFNMYEDVTRVPLIVRWPGKVPAGATCESFASNSIDIARTIALAAEAEPPESFVGEDLCRLAAEPTYRPRDYAFSQYFGTETGAYSMRMIRDERFKFVYHPTGDRHEFYDLSEDPGELTNRIDDSLVSDEVQRLKAALFDTMKANKDPLANRWTSVELKDEPTIAAEKGMPLPR
ncbi:MAG: sulfatase-like hydrolase/transferase [Opitutales bacterium]